MHGAIELVKLRGDSQFQHPLGLRLFLQLNSTILIGCMQHDIKVPTDLINLRCKASSYVNPMDPKLNVSEIVVQFVELRVAIKHGLLNKALLDAARSLDVQLSTIAEYLPHKWKYETIKIQSPCRQVYEQHFHVYSDHHITHTWNNIRIVRILLNTLLREQRLSQARSLEGPTFSQDLEDDAGNLSDLIASLSKDILASVAQYTRLPRLSYDSWVSCASTNTPNRSSPPAGHAIPLPGVSSSGLNRSKSESDGFTLYEMSRCYSLIFPLYIAGASEVCHSSLRQWVLYMLEYMQNNIGIKEAAVAAGCLKQRETINPWSVYAKIGSYSFSA